MSDDMAGLLWTWLYGFYFGVMLVVCIWRICVLQRKRSKPLSSAARTANP